MDPKQWTFAPMKSTKGESEQCGGQVRWRFSDGLLEQLWIITEYTGSRPSGRREEWRIVPNDMD